MMSVISREWTVVELTVRVVSEHGTDEARERVESLLQQHLPAEIKLCGVTVARRGGATMTEREQRRARADVLKAHIEECPKHPMSTLKAEVRRLQAEVDRLTERVAVYQTKGFEALTRLGTEAVSRLQVELARRARRCKEMLEARAQLLDSRVPLLPSTIPIAATELRLMALEIRREFPETVNEESKT